MVKETEEAKRTNFFKIVILLADIVVDVFRRFVTHKLPQGQDLHEFLTINQHALYHKWVYNIPCCRSDCYIAIETSQPRKPKICLMHFETMFNTNGREKEAHEQRENGKVLQHCICKVSVKSGVYVGGLDLSTCYVLLTDFLMISSQEKKWLKCILEQRNGFNSKLNDKSLDIETFTKIWEQLEVPLLLIATEIERSFSEDILIRIQTLSKRTPSAKTFVKSYEKYLEWFSRDDILRRELKYAKQQRMQQSPPYSNLDSDKRVLVITEVIMIDLLKDDDDVETAIERHPPDNDFTLERQSPDGMETREKTDDPMSQKSAFPDAAISGANSASRHRMDVVITYKNNTDTGHNAMIIRTKSSITQSDHESKDDDENDSKGEITDEPITYLGLPAQSQNDIRQQEQNDVDKQRLPDTTEQRNDDETMQNLKAGHTRQQSNEASSELNDNTKEKHQKENIDNNKKSSQLTADKTKNFPDFYQTVITLEIPVKTRWQNMALIRNLQNHVLELSGEKIKTILFSVESDSLCIHTEIAQELFYSRPTLRESLSEFLHKVFQFCMTNDRFSVNATLKITDPNGIDSSLFVTESTSTQDTTILESVKANNNPFITITEPNTPIDAQSLEKTQDCAACKIKDKEIHNLYKQIKLLKTVKPRPPIVVKCTQCILKEKRLFLLEQEKLKVENEVQQKDREISSLQSDIQSKERAMLTYDKLEHTNALLDKQQIEPPEIVTRLPLFPRTVGAYMHVERPITEQVLKKPLHPSVSFTQKKYLSSIRRYNDFLPTKRNTVLRYSYSELKRRGPFQLPNLPSLYSFSTDKLFQRPISVRGKHMVPEKSESFIGSSKDQIIRFIHFTALYIPFYIVYCRPKVY